MESSPIILPAGSEFTYCKVFASLFQIFAIMNTNYWLLAQYLQVQSYTTQNPV